LCDHAVVPPEIRVIALPSDNSEFAPELHRLLVDVNRATGISTLTGECSPPVDVYETDEVVELVMDLPGLDAQLVRVAAKEQTILIAGEKRPRRASGEASFRLVERGYGRFARATRISGACDTTRARATLSNGELRVRIPKITDRRGGATAIPISTETPEA